MTTVKRRATNDDHDLVRLYLNDAGQYPLLTKDDEARLAQEIEAGRTARAMLDDEKKKPTPTERRALRRRVRTGDEAHSVFVKSNLRLVVSIAKRYQASGVPLLDLIQEGNLGLIHAVDKFDWQRGFKFSTYATWWIRQAISRGIANTSRTIRLPVHAGDNLTKLHRARADLEVRFGRKATYAELAIELGTTEEKVRETALISAEPLSLSQKLSDDGDAELGDLVEDRGAPTPFEAAAASLLPAEVEKMLSQLDLRERRILSLRFGLDRGEPRTLEEVGEHFDLTRERIRQIEARAMSKLRHPTYAADVDALLGV
jgi:RNA polymerase sigma factor (sigma-70 family)